MKENKYTIRVEFKHEDRVVSFGERTNDYHSLHSLSWNEIVREMLDDTHEFLIEEGEELNK